MKRYILSAIAVLSLALGAFGQQWPVAQPQGSSSYENGVFYAPNFGTWSLKLASAMTGGSTTVFTTNKGFVTTPDGFIFSPFAVNEKIQIGTPASGIDILTVSAVSNCNLTALDGLTPTCTVTVSGAPTNSHNPGEPIVSADSGIIEAMAYAGNVIGTAGNGIGQTSGGTAGAVVFWAADCGIITLNTGGTTTTSACLVPNEFYNQGIASRVTTTVTTAASYSIGATGLAAAAATAFAGANTNLTAGSTGIAFQTAPAENHVTGLTVPNLTTLTLTTNVNPGAGAVKVKAWGYSSVQPSF